MMQDGGDPSRTGSTSDNPPATEDHAEWSHGRNARLGGRFGGAPSRVRTVAWPWAAQRAGPGPLPGRRGLQGLGTTVFAEMSALAERTGVDQPGPGLPRPGRPRRGGRGRRRGHPGRPQPVPAGPGHPGAAPGHRRATSTASTGSSSTPTTEVLVTAGATEAITAAMLALCETGDEVVVFEPFYDSYGGRHRHGRGPRRVVPLEPPDWTFDPDRLAAAVTPGPG